MIRRVNLYAGPCAGKSTVALELAGAFKRMGKSFELVDEFVKAWAYQKITPTGFDQLLIFANQMHKEDIVLRNGVRHLVSDSPMFLSACYAKMFTPFMYEPLKAMEESFENLYPSMHLFIERGNKPYSQEGRYQTYEEAKEIDVFLKKQLEDSGIKYTSFSFDDLPGIIKFVKGAIEK